MTEDQIKTFIKEKIAPLFDGMAADDILEIIDSLRLRQTLFATFTVSLKKS